MVSDKRNLVLNNVESPQLVFGTMFYGKTDEEVQSYVYNAIKNGYRHLDCSPIYGTEKNVGLVIEKAIQDNLVTREELFITSKLWNSFHSNAEEGLRITLTDLKLDYLDCFIIHWPTAWVHNADLPWKCEWEELPSGRKIPKAEDNWTIQQTWQSMEHLVEIGLTRSIGVSNFHHMTFANLLGSGLTRPIINQFEIHPYHQRHQLVEWIQNQKINPNDESSGNIAVSAWGVFGSGQHDVLSDPVIVQLAEKYNVTPGHIIHRWLAQRNIFVLTKSSNEERQRSAFKIHDENEGFTLSDEDMELIKTLDKGERTDLSPYFNGYDFFA